MSLSRRAWAIAQKDLRAEWRDRESVTVMAYFAFLVLVLFAFALGGEPALLRGAGAGLFWLAVTFTSVLGLGRSVQGELEHGCLDGLLSYPAAMEAIYVGKFLSNLAVLLAVELVSVPAFAVLYSLERWSALPMLLVVALPATLGFAAAGTLLSTMTAGLRAREALLPFLLFPITIPLLLAAVKSTEIVLRGEPLGAALPWLKLMGAFDVLVLVIAVLTFEYLVEE